jgi:hypothetical protein
VNGGPELPPLHQAVLDAATLAAYFADLAQCAEALQVHARLTGAERGAPPVPMSLGEACDALRGGTAKALQVRYRYQGAVWFDTLLGSPEGVRIVRMQEPAAGG